jgi:protein-S-isoprenylcysteine O-methyltransferase Ste14
MDVGLVSYLLVLVAGVALTVAIGAILRRSGQAMLVEAYPEPRARGLVQLITVGFYLVAFGVLALISTVDVPVDGVVQTVVTKFGVVSLILGAVYGLTLVLLGRVRDARRRAALDEELSAAMRAARA